MAELVRVVLLHRHEAAVGAECRVEHVSRHGCRATEHVWRRLHELTWHACVGHHELCRGRRTVVHAVRRMSIFSCSSTAMHLRHLLELHHVLLVDDHRDAKVRVLAELRQLGHFAAVRQLLDVLLSRQLRGLSSLLVILYHLVKLQQSPK